MRKAPPLPWIDVPVVIETINRTKQKRINKTKTIKYNLGHTKIFEKKKRAFKILI